jgi:hypothetical protein
MTTSLEDTLQKKFWVQRINSIQGELQQLAVEPRSVLPPINFSLIDRSWNIGNTTVIHQQSAQTGSQDPKKKDDEKFFKMLIAGVVGLGASVAYTATILRSYQTAKRLLSESKTIQGYSEAWQGPLNPLQENLKAVNSAYILIREKIAKEKTIKVITGAELIGSATLMIIGAVVKSCLIAHLAWVGLIAGGVALMGVTCYYSGFNQELRNDYQGLNLSQVQTSLRSLKDTLIVRHAEIVVVYPAIVDVQQCPALI